MARATSPSARSQYPIQRMPLEQIAELKIFAEHVEALVPAKPFQLGGVDAAFHAGGERAALEAVAAEVASLEAGGDGAGLDDLRHGLRRDRGAADAGQGRGVAGPWVWRQPDPPEHRPFADAGRLLPEREGANRAELGIAVGEGNGHRRGLLAFGLRQGKSDAAFGGLEVIGPDRGEFGTPQRAGEAHQDERAVAQAAQIVPDRREQPAHDGRGRRDLLARDLAAVGGVPADAGDGFRHANVVGGHRAAGGAVQIADGGAAEFDGVGREPAAALAGEEGGDIRALSGQGREVVARTPRAPGADGGAVGPPGIVGFGHAGVGRGGAAFTRQGSVQDGLGGFGGFVEPTLDLGRIAAERRCGKGLRRWHERSACGCWSSAKGFAWAVHGAPEGRAGVCGVLLPDNLIIDKAPYR